MLILGMQMSMLFLSMCNCTFTHDVSMTGARTKDGQTVDINTLPIVLVNEDLNSTEDLVNFEPSMSRGR